MTLIELKERCRKIGIPYSHGLFKEPTEPPHLVTSRKNSNNFGADNKVYLKKNAMRLELTTLEVDVDLENKIEEKVFYDTYYEKYDTDIQEEKIHNVSYFFEI